MSNMKEKKLKNGYVFYSPEDATTDYENTIKETNKTHYKHYTPNPNDIIMDIGANAGDMPLLWSKLCKHIHSYEPVPSTYNVLKYNVEANGIENVTLNNTAVGGEDGDVTMWINHKAKHGSLCASSIPRKGRVGYRVKKVDFNTEMERIRPNIVKIDIEGGEKEILDNLKPSVLDSVEVLFIEFHPNLFSNPQFEEEGIALLDNYFSKKELIMSATHFDKKIASLWMFKK